MVLPRVQPTRLSDGSQKLLIHTTHLSRWKTLQMTYRDFGAVPDVVDGIPPGTILPLADFPDELRCPWCEDGKLFKNESGLRGHAYGKHGLRWEIPPDDKPNGPLVPYGKMTAPIDRVNLKPWHMIGIAMHELYGLSWTEVGERLGRGHTVLSDIGRSPAGVAFRERLLQLAETPESVALLLMKANSLNVTADFMTALEWAKEARDYAAVHRMTKDLLTLAGAEERQTPETKQNVQELHIHLDAKDLAAPIVTSTVKVLDADIVDD